jgi:hypothetical protein
MNIRRWLSGRRRKIFNRHRGGYVEGAVEDLKVGGEALWSRDTQTILFSRHKEQADPPV